MMKLYFPKIILLILIYFVAIGCTNTKKLDAGTKNLSADFYIGGFFGASYRVKIQNNLLTYSTSQRGTELKEQKQTLNQSELDLLEKTLVELNASQWQKIYSNPLVKDGIHWSIHYKTSKLQIDSSGNNLYPDNFKQLKQYISQTLLKGKTFQ